MKRHVFYISDSTGITAKTLGKSVLSQFKDVEFEQHVIPYIDTTEKAHEVASRINKLALSPPPIIFDTFVNSELHQILSSVDAVRFDLLNIYLKPLEEELKVKATPTIGKAHGTASDIDYIRRMDAIQYAMENDDGVDTQFYKDADVILIGASRCGKTPTSIYLALHFGLFAANYPITEDDIDSDDLPEVLNPFKTKLFGLSIEPERLSVIRHERRPGSRYASFQQCCYEIDSIEAMFRRKSIPFISTTDASVEEIASRMINALNLSQK